MKFIFM